MRNKDKEQVEIGFMDIPMNYVSLTEYRKDVVCNHIIDSILIQIDESLPQHINRITFLIEILESSLLTNEQEENYEICAVIRDMINKLND
jgi:hypothetical protein